MAAIDIQRSGATAILTMNRPEQRNALDHPMREAFAAAAAEVHRFLTREAPIYQWPETKL